MPLRLLSSSPSNQHDFAIFEVQGSVSPDRFVLQPKIIRPFVRGLDILFSGFPHGISDLLIQRAIVAGLRSDCAFYLARLTNRRNFWWPHCDSAQRAAFRV